MTLTDAKTFVARVDGGHNDTREIARAADAILATAQKWSNEHNWEYLRKDNSATRSITGTVADAGGGVGTVVTVTSTAGVNVGQAVSVTDDLSAVTATTVASITSLTVFTLAASVSSGTVTAVLAAYIPVLEGVDTYYAPHDASDFYGARLLTSKRHLTFVRLREVNRQIADQSASSYADAFMLATPGSGSGWTAADQRVRLRLVGIPGAAENLHVDYYRRIDGAASTVDLPDDYIYAFLDDAKAWYLMQKNAQDPRAQVLGALAARGLQEAIKSDGGVSDEDVRMKSQFETFSPFSYTPTYYPDVF